MPSDLTHDRATDSRRIPALTSLRIFAAVVVFLHHLEGFFGVPDSSMPLRRIAVSFFFVLSGYVLTLVYGRADRPLSVIGFWKRRVVRIYPLHLVVLALTLLLGFDYFAIRFASAPVLWCGKFIATSALVQAWYPDSAWALSFNGVAWSISVLIFFYLLFPGLIRFKHRLPLVGVCAVLLSAGIMYAVMTGEQSGRITPQAASSMIHFFPPIRLVEFVIGMIACEVVSRGKLGALVERMGRGFGRASFVDIGLLALCLGGWHWGSTELAPQINRAVRSQLTHQSTPTIASHEAPQSSDVSEVRRKIDADDSRTDPNAADRVHRQAETVSFVLRWYGYIGFSIPAALMIVWFCHSGGAIGTLLRWPALVYLGELSFAIFLVHRVIIVWVFRQFGEAIGEQMWAGSLICAALTLLVSIALYHLVEAPMAVRHSAAETKAAWKRWRTSIRTTWQPRYSNAFVLLAIACLATGVVVAVSFPVAPRTAEPHVEFEHGLKFHCVTRSVEPGIILSIERFDDNDLHGKLVAQWIDESGTIRQRRAIRSWESGAPVDRPSSFESPLLLPQEISGIAYVRLVYIPDGESLSPIRNGVSDRSGKGFVVWSDPDLSPRLQRRLIEPR